MYSTGSVIIDLGAKTPRLGHQGGVFYILEINQKKDAVELIGYYSDEIGVIKKITIHIVDDNTIKIELHDRRIEWLMNPKLENLFHRVPKNAPLEPLGPEGI